MFVEEKARTGGRILVDALIGNGADIAFGVPGESYLAVLDAFYDSTESIRLIPCRQEGGAAFMAEAHGKLTGKPGICFVTRGPGATNASIGVHTAYQDSTPMILFIGQVGSDFIDREAFQEIDYRRMFGPMAKWVSSIDSVQRIPEYINRAFQIALSGRPGPVVLALPEDMLASCVSVDDVSSHVIAYPDARRKDVDQLGALLDKAERPLLILGGSGWTAQARNDLRCFAESAGLPVATTFRRQDLFENSHPCYVGCMGLGMDPRQAQRVKQADLLVVVGSRLGEMTTLGYSLLAPGTPRQALVHVHVDPGELGVLYKTAVPINAAMPEFAAALLDLDIPDAARWESWTRAGHLEYQQSLIVPEVPFDVDFGVVMTWLNEHLPPDAIVTNGAGNYAGWVHRYFQYGPSRRQLAPTSGAMGYGVPAAVAAKLARPQRTVVSFSGDGCYMMNGQELATAVQHDLQVIFLVINNGMYGTIRMHQESHYPGRPSATSLTNPDFAALARAYGAHGETVERTADFAPAFERAQASGKPAVIELRTDPRAITSRFSAIDRPAA